MDSKDLYIDYGYGIQLAALERDESLLLAMKNWRNNINIRKWCRQVGLLNFQNQSDWFDKIHYDSSIEMFRIGFARDDYFETFGVCGLTSIDHINRHAEFSLYINSANQGRGHSKPALKTLFQFGFNELNLNRIWGETFDGNPAAKIFASLGMYYEGTRKEFYFKNGKYTDAHLFSIGATDFWNSCNSPIDIKTSRRSEGGNTNKEEEKHSLTEFRP